MKLGSVQREWTTSCLLLLLLLLLLMPQRGHCLPPAPSNVKLCRISPTAIKVNWDAPDFATITGYRVYYSMSPLSEMDQWQSIDIGSTTYTKLAISSLRRHAVYAVRVRARGADGRYGNFSVVVDTNSLPQRSCHMVQEFFARTHNPRSVMLAWKPPRTPGVARYKIAYDGSKVYRNQFNREIRLYDGYKTKFLPKEERTVYIEGLVPNTPYSFNISSKFADGSWGPSSHLQVQTATAAPPPFRPPEFLNASSESSLVLHLHGASSKNGPITNYLVVVVPEELANTKKPSDFSVSDMGTDAPESAWIAAKFKRDLPLEFTLGSGLATGTMEYINRPLRKGQTYRVFLRAITKSSKFTDSDFSEPLSTNEWTDTQESSPDSANLLRIIGPVGGGVVLIILIITIIIFLKIYF